MISVFVGRYVIRICVPYESSKIYENCYVTIVIMFHIITKLGKYFYNVHIIMLTIRAIVHGAEKQFSTYSV